MRKLSLCLLVLLAACSSGGDANDLGEGRPASDAVQKGGAGSSGAVAGGAGVAGAQTGVSAGSAGQPGSPGGQSQAAGAGPDAQAGAGQGGSPGGGQQGGHPSQAGSGAGGVPAGGQGGDAAAGQGGAVASAGAAAGGDGGASAGTGGVGGGAAGEGSGGTGGVCSCGPGVTCCDGNCVEPTSDPTNCGGCGIICPAEPAPWACVDGVCVPPCPDGHLDCDGDPSNGCEADLSSDPDNCGSCGTLCEFAGAPGVCMAGSCITCWCPGGMTCCGGGLCVDPLSDVANCGGCGLDCAAGGGDWSCVQGVCEPACPDGQADCDDDPANGCEAVLADDPSHCGACGNACQPGAMCLGGVCSLCGCPAGMTCCGAAVGCFDLSNDAQHCGDCATDCTKNGKDWACVAGTCALACPFGKGDCDGKASNGCEADLLNDENNCGACLNSCATPNGVAQCNFGMCSCCDGVGHANCDGSCANGCETDITNNKLHCGGCGMACNETNGTATCASSQCEITCDQGYADCDQQAFNGCEVDLGTNVNHCGDCSVACADGMVCVNASCTNP